MRLKGTGDLRCRGKIEHKSPNHFSESQVSFELLRYRMERMRNTAARKAESLMGLTRR